MGGNSVKHADGKAELKNKNRILEYRTPQAKPRKKRLVVSFNIVLAGVVLTIFGGIILVCLLFIYGFIET